MFSFFRTRFSRTLPGLLAGIALTASAFAADTPAARPIPLAGADELTPSRSEYFSWINNAWEGSDATQTRVNLDFFRWLHDTYGMKLDIYALDAGNLDTNGRRYGNTTSPGFLQKYPQGFGPLAKQAAAMNTRLGMWAGPDGFGNTPAEAAARAETVTALFRDHNFALLKLDGACGTLRREKWTEFDNMMTEIRRHVPDAILLNHRLKLGPGTRHATTFLLGGDETYIDVHMTNKTTGSHHRVAAISRELPPRLTRLTEDHGVCLSSCLDYWEDDLILQAFNRNLILAPEIYGNPWFLRDTEYARLAYIFNLHRHYRDILVHGQTLPPEKYGPNAVTRGDATTRFVTLRNLTWEPVTHTVTLDKEIGLEKPADANAQVRVRLYHPAYRDLGVYPYGAQIPIETAPFRSLLFKAVVEPAPSLDKLWADT
ncbi:MAG: hypothetical protein LBV54_02240, partial [Puniceicoccales bacterium]|nr:hypothetical protein [Puniceicoccales bacterium]